MRGVAPALTLTPRGPASGRRAAEGTSRVPSRGRGAWHRVETDILSCAGLFHSRGQWGKKKRGRGRGDIASRVEKSEATSALSPAQGYSRVTRLVAARRPQRGARHAEGRRL